MRDDESKLIDVSHVVEHEMVTYKGLPAPIICDYLSREASRNHYDEGTTFQIGKIEMVANTGTYVDSPFHRFADGKDLSELDLHSLANLDGMVFHVDPTSRAIGKNLFSDVDLKRKAILVHIGWAIERHGQIYADEFGWNSDFETLVATLFAKFATKHDPATERFWVAELDGERIGGVFVVRNAENPSIAQLRCLLMDPKGRGHGIGQRLVNECIAFATQAGYEKIMLWTNDVLISARRIYEAAGFSLMKEEHHHSFGHDLVGQFWMLDL